MSPPSDARAARSSAAGLPMSAMSTRWLKAPNGTTRSVGVPVTQRMSVVGMLADEMFGGQSGQRGFADAVGSEHDGARPRRIAQGNVELLQGCRVLRDVPSNRHRRILLRAVPASAMARMR